MRQEQILSQWATRENITPTYEVGTNIVTEGYVRSTKKQPDRLSDFIFLVKKYKNYTLMSTLKTLCANPAKKPIPAPANTNGAAGLISFSIKR